MWRLLVALILLYIAFDFADLMMPGAMNFDPDQSVDVASAQNVRGEVPLSVLPAVPRVGVALVVDAKTPVRRLVAAVIPLGTRHLGGPRAFPSESRSSSPEDH